MAKAVEFTDTRDFEREMDRMPNFMLHELAHAFHNRTLPGGFGNKEIKAAYEAAKKSGSYDKVERYNGGGRRSKNVRHYAMTNPMEYFAENSEAYFSRDDRRRGEPVARRQPVAARSRSARKDHHRRRRKSAPGTHDFAANLKRFAADPLMTS